jgi:NhaA family Na+:H+ antiporter
LGIGLWLAFLQSGVHATVAGVLLAMTIPARQRIDNRAFLARSEKILDEFRYAEKSGEASVDSATKNAALHLLADDCARAESPMLRCEHALAPWNKHVLMPIFALANAGVVLGTGAVRALVDPISLGVICGLALGKPIDIVLFSWLATRNPGRGDVGWRYLAGDCWRWNSGRNRLHHVALHCKPCLLVTPPPSRRLRCESWQLQLRPASRA